MPKVKVPWLCSRSQPGIKVIIRDIRGHLFHTVTFLVFLFLLYISTFVFYVWPFVFIDVILLFYLPLLLFYTGAYLYSIYFPFLFNTVNLFVLYNLFIYIFTSYFIGLAKSVKFQP